MCRRSGASGRGSPRPADPTQDAADRKPGVAGIYLLTPLASTPTTVADLPTYLLTPSATVNFSQHVDDKVEVAGVRRPRRMPPTCRRSRRRRQQAGEQAEHDGMPRLTVKTLKMVTSCP